MRALCITSSKDHELESVVSGFAGPTLSQKTRKDGAPAGDDHISPAEALKAELEKKDAEIKRLHPRTRSGAHEVGIFFHREHRPNKLKKCVASKSSPIAWTISSVRSCALWSISLRDKLGSGVVVLGSATNGNVSLIVGVTKDLTSRIQAGKVIGPVAQKVGGKGGGRPDLAEAGGKDPGALDAALGEAYGVVESLLGN